MSHEAGNQRGKEGGNGNKTEISLKRDQRSRVEKRLIELGLGWGWGWGDKNGMEESMIEKVEEGKDGGESHRCPPPFYFTICFKPK